LLSGVSTMLLAATLALRAGPTRATIRRLSAEERVQAIAYADVTPYLEALITKDRDRLDPRKYAAYVCAGRDNLDRIRHRDPLLESIARMIMNEDFAGIGRHVDEPDFPRGIFEDDHELRAIVLAILEAKKEEVLGVLRRQAADGRREPDGAARR
jgi:hypothetical protein